MNADNALGWQRDAHRWILVNITVVHMIHPDSVSCDGHIDVLTRLLAFLLVNPKLSRNDAQTLIRVYSSSSRVYPFLVSFSSYGSYMTHSIKNNLRARSRDRYSVKRV